MNTKIYLLLLSGSLLVVSALGQSYSVDCHKVAGGGGGSSNTRFSLSGAIGQHDADSKLSGGTYSVTGGFWSIFTVSAPSLPLLNIRLTPTNTVMVSWPSSATGFVLRQNGDLNTTNWVAPSEAILDDSSHRLIIVTPPAGARFYRLTKP
jgi:hypothetical protein